MTMDDTIVSDPPATRRIRRLAPLLIFLALGALIMAPGFMIERHTDAALTTAGEMMNGLPALR